MIALLGNEKTSKEDLQEDERVIGGDGEEEMRGEEERERRWRMRNKINCMIQAICWVLVHSLWQGVVLALAGGGVILGTKRKAAAVRYRLLCGLAGYYSWAAWGPPCL